MSDPRGLAILSLEKRVTACPECKHDVEQHTDDGDGCLAGAFDDGVEPCPCMLSKRGWGVRDGMDIRKEK